MSTKEYSIVADFKNEEIIGDCIAYGTWFDIELEECFNFIEIVKKNSWNIKRDFSAILKIAENN